ncbi:MAG TPA: hypothetical protein QKA14_02260, partial [Candidatus Megaira endosymbiont of Hartmannula sinica]|nr:hypothetical protein [Candidatus Megaera endosymbiont of Hartmannula sinica]
MSDLVDEIINERKFQKKVDLLKSTLPYIGIFTIIGFIIISFISYRNMQIVNNNQKFGRKLLESIISENKTKNSTKDVTTYNNKILVNIKEESNNKISELANLKIALQENKHNINYEKKLEDIINDSQYQKLTKSYARILLVTNILNKKDFNIKDLNNINNYLKYYFKNNNIDLSKPLSSYSMLLKAIAYKQVGGIKNTPHYLNHHS